MLFWIFPVIVLVIFLIQAIVIARYIRVWLKARFCGANISLMGIVGMRLRRLDPDRIVDCCIQSVQAESPISHVQIERAALQGCDIEKLTLAYIETERQGRGFTFEDLVDAERRGQLAGKLDGE